MYSKFGRRIAFGLLLFVVSIVSFACSTSVEMVEKVKDNHKPELEPEKVLEGAISISSSYSFNIKTSRVAKLWEGNIYYSYDNINWKTGEEDNVWDSKRLSSSDTPAEDGKYHIYLRGVGNKTISNWEDYFEINYTNSKDPNIIADITIDGDIRNLLDYTDLESAEENMADACFSYFMYNCKSLKSFGKDFKLPKTVTKECYLFMFGDCVNLENTPELPCLKLESSCYFSMFDGCKKIKNPPALPATKLAESCYEFMFYNCENLESIPLIKAELLPSHSCNYMFVGCKKIKFVQDDTKNEYSIPNLEDINQKAFELMFDNSNIEPGKTYYTTNPVIK